MADAVTFARGVDDAFFPEVLLLLGPLLLHAASGIANMTTAAAILLVFFRTTVHSDSDVARGRCTARCHENRSEVRYLRRMKRDRYLFTTAAPATEGPVTDRV